MFNFNQWLNDFLFCFFSKYGYYLTKNICIKKHINNILKITDQQTLPTEENTINMTWEVMDYICRIIDGSYDDEDCKYLMKTELIGNYYKLQKNINIFKIC